MYSTEMIQIVSIYIMPHIHKSTHFKKKGASTNTKQENFTAKVSKKKKSMSSQCQTHSLFEFTD